MNFCFNFAESIYIIRSIMFHFLRSLYQFLSLFFFLFSFVWQNIFLVCASVGSSCLKIAPLRQMRTELIPKSIHWNDLLVFNRRNRVDTIGSCIFVINYITKYDLLKINCIASMPRHRFNKCHAIQFHTERLTHFSIGSWHFTLLLPLPLPLKLSER